MRSLLIFCVAVVVAAQPQMRFHHQLSPIGYLPPVQTRYVNQGPAPAAPIITYARHAQHLPLLSPVTYHAIPALQHSVPRNFIGLPHAVNFAIPQVSAPLHNVVHLQQAPPAFNPAQYDLDVRFNEQPVQIGIHTNSADHRVETPNTVAQDLYHKQAEQSTTRAHVSHASQLSHGAHLPLSAPAALNSEVHSELPATVERGITHVQNIDVSAPAPSTHIHDNNRNAHHYHQVTDNQAPLLVHQNTINHGQSRATPSVQHFSHDTRNVHNQQYNHAAGPFSANVAPILQHAPLTPPPYNPGIAAIAPVHQPASLAPLQANPTSVSAPQIGSPTHLPPIDVRAPPVLSASLRPPIITPPATHAPIITKHFYLHSAPEEDEEEERQHQIIAGPAHKHYRVIFIKAPSHSSKAAALRIAQAQTEEKTVIYVLSKKTDPADIRAHIAEASHKVSKPEVFFIKYKTPEEANHAQQQIQEQYNILGGTSEYSDEGISPIHSVVGSIGQPSFASSSSQQSSSLSKEDGIRNYLPPRN